ncbi:hypothetical protein D9M70_629740 [compost metagenome]
MVLESASPRLSQTRRVPPALVPSVAKTTDAVPEPSTGVSADRDSTRTTPTSALRITRPFAQRLLFGAAQVD